MNSVAINPEVLKSHHFATINFYSFHFLAFDAEAK
jgi:hypothetical protein